MPLIDVPSVIHKHQLKNASCTRYTSNNEAYSCIHHRHICARRAHRVWRMLKDNPRARYDSNMRVFVITINGCTLDSPYSPRRRPSDHRPCPGVLSLPLLWPVKQESYY
eukprot:2219007-Pyramimonas_sp.AAC.3